jgi:hypothetical protein
MNWIKRPLSIPSGQKFVGIEEISGEGQTIYNLLFEPVNEPSPVPPPMVTSADDPRA